MKLEEGKWYKWFQTNHNNTHIGKYSNDSSENAAVKMKPWLIHSKEYCVDGTFEKKFMQDIVEITDLTEISKMLPDGHEDKVDKIAKPKFIVGKWYKNLNYGKNWIAKAISDSHMSGDNFYHGDYITDSKVFKERSISKSSLVWNDDVVECPLSEIQEYLPDGHVDKIGSNSKRYTATMKFFEQLREPERSEAIENYNENYYNSVPSTLTNALEDGFGWSDSAQEHVYWDNIYVSIEDNTYFKEPETETLVFGKYKVGDVVVSLTTSGSSREEGSLFIVKEDSVPHKLCYDTCFGSSLPNDWRLATPEEVSAYNKGIKNIADIKPKDYNEAVNCTTQEEWDFALSKFNPRGLITNNFSKNSNNKCIITASSNSEYVGCYSSKNYLVTNNYTILTFKQWCDKYNHSYVEEPISLEGRYIKCLKENDWNGGKTKVGQVLTIKKVDTQGDLFISGRCLDKSRLESGEFELLPIDYTPDLIKEEQTMFKKGDYIVTLINDGDCGKVNYCSKQNQDDKDLYPEIDTKGIKGNGNSRFTFSDKSGWKWRFATKEEGEEYEKHGKPYNVTNLLSSLIPNKPSEVDISYRVDKIGNFYIDDICVSNCTSLAPKEVYPNYSIPKPTTIILKTKSKSIKL